MFSRGYLDAATQVFFLGGRVRHVDVSQAAPLGLGARLCGSALERCSMGVSMSQASSCKMGITAIPYKEREL